MRATVIALCTPWEQSVTVPALLECQVRSWILPCRLSHLCEASVVTARDAAPHRMEDPDNGTEKTITE